MQEQCTALIDTDSTNKDPGEIWSVRRGGVAKVMALQVLTALMVVKMNGVVDQRPDVLKSVCSMKVNAFGLTKIFV